MRKVLEAHITPEGTALLAMVVVGWVGAVATVAILHTKKTTSLKQPALVEVIYHSQPPPPAPSPTPVKIKAVLKKARYISLN